jgi:glutathione peroxidase-family protein
VEFPVIGKLSCNDADFTHPVYLYLTSVNIDENNHDNKKPLKWNFVKFLCDKNGIPIKRYGPKESPLSFEKDIIEMFK